MAMAPPVLASTPSSTDSANSDSASLASVTDRGALMLPEPAVPDPNARMPALPLNAESLQAGFHNSRRDLGLQEERNIEAVPARLTPRGSLVALSPPPPEGAARAPAAEAPPPDVALRQSNKDQNPLAIRAEAAEQQARKLQVENKKLEAEVRKLRADAYFQRIRKNEQVPRCVSMEKAEENQYASSVVETSADAWAARLVSEERAVQAETEVLRLHTELQAARIQFAIVADKTGTTSAPPPPVLDGVENKEFANYKVIPCLRYVFGCLRFFILQKPLALCRCFCCRSSKQHRKMIEEGDESPQKPPVTTFCVVDRA